MNFQLSHTAIDSVIAIPNLVRKGGFFSYLKTGQLVARLQKKKMEFGSQ